MDGKIVSCSPCSRRRPGVCARRGRLKHLRDMISPKCPYILLSPLRTNIVPRRGKASEVSVLEASETEEAK